MVEKSKSVEESSYDLDLICHEFPMTQRGVKKTYRLYEASGEAAGAYRNAIMAGITLGPSGKPNKIGKIADVEPLLVAKCIKEVVTDEKGDQKEAAISDATVRSWPSRVQKSLFERIKTMSDLEEQSPEKQTLEEALQHPSSPVSLEDFRKWLNETLPDMDDKYDYTPLKKWMKPSAEELAKNEQSDMTDG